LRPAAGACTCSSTVGSYGKYFTYFFRQSRRRERFLQESLHIEDSMVTDRVVRVTRYEEQFDLWPEQGDPFGQFPTIHLGHYQIRITR
jgi:hypothetical protein